MSSRCICVHYLIYGPKNECMQPFIVHEIGKCSCLNISVSARLYTYMYILALIGFIHTHIGVLTFF